MRYEPVIGLEIHTELNTKTKMFCYSLNDPDERHPNINVCPICMGHPGTLPTINREAVKKVIMTGLALNGEIPEFSQFDRKNYFYPDLPKGSQISQYEHPLVKGGHLRIPRHETHNTTHETEKIIRITRIHLEEDTGRLMHDKETNSSLVDFNRAGVPLMELVTEPDLRNGEEVRAFGEELQKILRCVRASDADMEKGQMRVEVNISLRPAGQEEFGTKVEIKNINSFKYAADAVDYEIRRQTAILERGEKVVQETRGWNERKDESFSQRSKEDAHDYRYFPEPDLPPLQIPREFVDQIRAELPELPTAKRLRFAHEYGLKPDTVEILVHDKGLADYFEKAASELKAHENETPDKPAKNPIKTLASLMTGDFIRMLDAASASAGDIRITPENFAKLALYGAENKISSTATKQALEEMFRSGDDPSDIIERLGLWQMSDADALEDIAAHIVRENPAAVADYQNGKIASLQFLVGQVMKESRGTANPKIVQEIIKKILSATVEPEDFGFSCIR